MRGLMKAKEDEMAKRSDAPRSYEISALIAAALVQAEAYGLNQPGDVAIAVEVALGKAGLEIKPKRGAGATSSKVQEVTNQIKADTGTRQKHVAGFQGAIHEGVGCDATYGVWKCSRLLGHHGAHEAEGGERTHTW